MLSTEAVSGIVKTLLGTFLVGVLFSAAIMLRGAFVTAKHDAYVAGQSECRIAAEQATREAVEKETLRLKLMVQRYAEDADTATAVADRLRADATDREREIERLGKMQCTIPDKLLDVLDRPVAAKVRK